METTFDHSFLVRSFLLGLLGGASSSEESPDSMDHSNQYAKLGPFFASSFGCNFPTNDNQTFIVYMKSMLILFRKGLCGISSFYIHPRKKVMSSNLLQVLGTRGSTQYVLDLVGNVLCEIQLGKVHTIFDVLK